jgi:hypothetical protein
MRKYVRCKSMRNEVWVAPGGTGSDGYPQQKRDMRAQCVLNDGHEANHQWGDWLELGVARG